MMIRPAASVLVLLALLPASLVAARQDAPAAPAPSPTSAPAPASTPAPTSTPAPDTNPAPSADPSLTRPAVDEATTAAINDLLARMSRTVLGADVEGYLSLIDPSDSCFVAEQTYWAKDLKKFPTLEFEQTLESPGFDPDGSVVGTLRWAWKVRKGEAEPKQRTLSFTARFTKGEQGWRYAGEAWLEHRGERVIVFHQPGMEELARGIAEMFPEIRAHVEPLFGLAVPGDQHVKLYAEMKHLQASICLSYTDGLGGWNEPGESIRQLVSRRQTAQGSKVVLAHEFGHVCTFAMGAEGSHMPWWVLEGAAEFAAQSFANSQARNDRAIRDLASKGSLAAWDDLTTFGKVAGANMGKVYSQGHHMINFITARFGDAARNTFLRTLAQGRALDDASRTAFGVPFADLDAEWRLLVSPEPSPKSGENAKD